MVHITILNTQGLYAYALINALESDRYTWADKIERFVQDNRIESRREIYFLDKLARDLGLNTKPFDSQPYGDFLTALHGHIGKTVIGIRVDSNARGMVRVETAN